MSKYSNQIKMAGNCVPAPAVLQNSDSCLIIFAAKIFHAYDSRTSTRHVTPLLCSFDAACSSSFLILLVKVIVSPVIWSREYSHVVVVEVVSLASCL